MTTSEDLTDALADLLAAEELAIELSPEPLTCVSTFRDAGVLTTNDGLVLTFADGSEFQLTIVRSR